MFSFEIRNEGGSRNGVIVCLRVMRESVPMPPSLRSSRRSVSLCTGSEGEAMTPAWRRYLSVVLLLNVSHHGKVSLWSKRRKLTGMLWRNESRRTSDTHLLDRTAAARRAAGAAASWKRSTSNAASQECSGRCTESCHLRRGAGRRRRTRLWRSAC